MAVDKLILPEGYVNEFTILETEIAIKKIKDLFQKTLAERGIIFCSIIITKRLNYL